MYTETTGADLIQDVSMAVGRKVDMSGEDEAV